MAAFFTVLLGASALLLGYFLYDFSRANFIRETEDAIDHEIEHIRVIANEYDSAAFTQHIQNRSQQSNPVYLYQASDGTRLAGNIEAVPTDLSRIKEGILRFGLEQDDKVRTFAAKIHTFPDGSTLLIGRDIHDIVAGYEKLKLFSGFIMLFMLIVVLVSFVISIFVVSRTNMIANTAMQIMDTGDLSRRISIDTHWDDLSNLAQILNALLDRIEELMQGVRDVSDNIAHDLRTPLTRLRNQLEAVQDRSLEKDEQESLLSEADHLLTTFSAILRIANLEKGKRHQTFCDVDLHIVLRDVVELYEPFAEERNITLAAAYEDVEPITGDRDLLFQVFSNLLDNAIKFSPEAGEVSILLAQDDDQAVIRIADQGIGISEYEREKVFDRFYRTEKSRTTAGSGLGLSLVKAALALHHGTIELEDNRPGLCVTIVF